MVSHVKRQAFQLELSQHYSPAQHHSSINVFLK